MPKAIPGKNMQTILRKIIMSFVRYAEASAKVNNNVIMGAKKKIDNAMADSIIIPIFRAYMYEIFSFLYARAP